MFTINLSDVQGCFWFIRNEQQHTSNVDTPPVLRAGIPIGRWNLKDQCHRQGGQILLDGFAGNSQGRDHPRQSDGRSHVCYVKPGVTRRAESKWYKTTFIDAEWNEWQIKW